MPELDPRELDARENGRIIKTAVTPRPIAWISTVDTAGNENLAPFSSYNYANLGQPVVLFNSSFTREGTRKDTALNALETEEFAVNIVTGDLIEQMDQTSTGLPGMKANSPLPMSSPLPVAGLRRRESPMRRSRWSVRCSIRWMSMTV